MITSQQYSYLNLSLSEMEQFLVAVLTHRESLDCEWISQFFYSLPADQIYAKCCHNKIESIAADALIKCLGNKELSKDWLEVHSKIEKRVMKYMEELDSIALLLSRYDIPLVALKNSGISRGMYSYYAACPMGDIDVLVKRTDFRKTHEILVNNGYEMKFRSSLEDENLELAERKGGSEYSVTLSNGSHLWFELQWRPVSGRWIRPDQEPDTDELIKRSVEIKGSKARLLSPEDNLLQVALHTAKHSYVRAPGFRLHTDVDRIIRSVKVDWTLFVDRVMKLQVKTAVFFSLALAYDLLKTPVPIEVLDKLRPASWKVWLISRWLEKVGLFDPDGKKWGRVGYVLFVALLYDSSTGLAKGIFPSQEWMKERYGIKSQWLLPLLYIHRIFDLIWRRTLNRG